MSLKRGSKDLFKIGQPDVINILKTLAILIFVLKLRISKLELLNVTNQISRQLLTFEYTLYVASVTFEYLHVSTNRHIYQVSEYIYCVCKFLN